MTLVAGAGLTFGGFVAATMSPSLREAVSDSNLFAATPPSPSDSPSNADDFAIGDMQVLAAQREHQSPDGFEVPSGDDFLANAAQMSGLDSKQDPSSPKPTGSAGGIQEFGVDGSPRPGQRESASGWAAALQAMQSAGVTNFAIQPQANSTRLRCDCWIMDGRVPRQLTGQGDTPTAAANDAVSVVSQFRSKSNWFSGGTGPTSSPSTAPATPRVDAPSFR